MALETGKAVMPTTGISPRDIEFQPLDKPQGGASEDVEQDTATLIPKRGSYSTQQRMMDRARHQNNLNHPIEINFSPGGSSLTTAEVPKRGSFVGDYLAFDDKSRNCTGKESKEYQSRAEKEFNFSRAAGIEMETAGAPQQQSFVLRRKQEEDVQHRKAVDKEYAEEVALQEDDLARWKSQKAAQAQRKVNDELQGAGAIPTPIISNKGSVRRNGDNSFVQKTSIAGNEQLHPENEIDSAIERGHVTHGAYDGDIDERQRAHISKWEEKEEIQFQPDGYLSIEPSTPPSKGSFVDKFSSGHIVPVGRIGSMVQREIHFSPGASEMETVAVPKTGSFHSAQKNDEICETTHLQLPALLPMKQQDACQKEGVEDETVVISNMPDNSSAIQTTKEHEYTLDPSIVEMEALLDAALNDERPENKVRGFSFEKGERVSSTTTESSYQIPSASFLKMGAALSNQNDSSAMLDALLDDDDDDFHVVDPTPRRQLGAESEDDDPDDLLDSMLGDEDELDEKISPSEKHYEHDDLLESLLDDDLCLDEFNGKTRDNAAARQEDDFMPSRSILNLEAILDDGLKKLGHPNLDHCRVDVQGTHDIIAQDSISRELGAILDESFAEEIEIDFEAIIDRKSFDTSLDHEIGEAARKTSDFDKAEAVVESIRQSSVEGNVNFGTGSKGLGRVVGRIFNARGPKKDAPQSTDKKKPKTSFFISRSMLARPESTVSSKVNNNKNQGGPPSSKDSVRRKVDPGGYKASSLDTTAKKSFMSATFSSAGRFGKKLEVTVDRSEDRAPLTKKDKKVRMKGSFMASTFASDRKANEISLVECEKAKEKEIEAKKIVVNLRPWRRKEKCTPVLNTSMKSPAIFPAQSRTGLASELAQKGKDFPPNMPDFVPCETPTRSPQNSAFSPRSCVSLSSQCTVTSFASPRKLGIRGCQSKYDPHHHRVKGPCELCVFRLSDADKEILDTKGRHFMVQFTTGGCTHCQVFQKDFDEPAVRLCPKCYSISHRESSKRCPGKGNLPGYSFAKVEFA
jgi:hypothetical protein